MEKGWGVEKDIQARNLRWTVTDTALSSDQRFLVSSFLFRNAGWIEFRSRESFYHAVNSNVWNSDTFMIRRKIF